MSSIVQIKDSAYDGLQSLRVYGNTRQNLWTNPSGTINGVTATANADGSVTISGSLETTTSGSYIATRQYILRPGSTYTLSIDRAIGGVGTYLYIMFRDAEGNTPFEAQLGLLSAQSRVTFTVPTSAASASMGIAVSPNSTTQTGTYRVMLNEGSTAEPWCPPGLNSVGDDGSVDIVTAGKNLFGISQEFSDLSGWSATQLYDDGDGWVRAEAASGAIGIWYKKSKIRFMPTTYTVSFEAYANKSVLVGYNYIMDSEKGSVELKAYGAVYPTATTEKQRLSLSFTLDKELNGSFMIGARGYSIPGLELHIRNVQLELGSTATAYEPPNVTTTSIDLQGHTLNALPDGTRDELHIDGGGNVVLEKRVETYIANGDEGWELSATSNAPYRMMVKNWSGNAKNDLLPINQFQADRLPKYPTTPNSGSTFVVVNGRYQLYAARDGIQDASAFSEWLESNPMTVIYPLAKPKTIDLGTIELPKLRKKPLVNTIWANGTAGGTGFSLAPEIDCEYNRWSTYCDGFKTHGKHSYFDMGCCLAARDTGTPEKKNITATVPYMSGFYDFSKLYGAIAFEARQLTYRFEFVEDSREELQQKKSQFLEWLSQVHDEEIADDDIPGRHFIGSLSEWEFEEGEEGQSGSLEVTFNCQPFLEADEDTTKTCSAGSNTVTVEGQPVNAYAKTSSGTATIQIGGVTQSVGTTEIRLSVQLQPGDNAVTVTGSAVTLRWRELTA